MLRLVVPARPAIIHTLARVTQVLTLLVVMCSLALADGIDTTQTWNLNATTLDCFRNFDVYTCEKCGFTYFSVHIDCANAVAFIHYVRRGPLPA
jgi:hypothetical protein